MKLFWGHQISSSLGSQFPITRGNQFSSQVTALTESPQPTETWYGIIRFLKKHVKTVWVVFLMRYLHQNVYTVFLAKVFQMPASKNWIHTCWKKHFIETACAKLHSHRVWVKCARLPLNSCIFQHHLPTFPAGTCSSIQACRGQEIG